MYLVCVRVALYRVKSMYIHLSLIPFTPCSVHLCASHEEELDDLNARLSAQEEEMYQKAQLVSTLQVRTQHISAMMYVIQPH